MITHAGALAYYIVGCRTTIIADALPVGLQFNTHASARELLEGHRVVYVEKLIRCGKAVQPNKERDLGAIVGEHLISMRVDSPLSFKPTISHQTVFIQLLQSGRWVLRLRSFTVRERQISYMQTQG